jgi:phage gp36-like protein
VATYITQTSGLTPAGDLTNAVGNPLLVQLCGDGAGGVSSTILPAIILDAEALVDSMLGPGYVVPIVGSVPRIVKRCSVDICVYYLYERKPEFYRQDGKNPQESRYKEAIRLLKDIREGQSDMGAETAESKSRLTGGVVNYSTKPFIVDSGESSSDGPTGGF